MDTTPPPPSPIGIQNSDKQIEIDPREIGITDIEIFYEFHARMRDSGRNLCEISIQTRRVTICARENAWQSIIALIFFFCEGDQGEAGKPGVPGVQGLKVR